MTSLSTVASVSGGTLRGADREFDAVSTDTRTLAPGELFFALRGARFDAQAFVAEAARRGAAGAVVEAVQPVPLAQVEVANPRRALGDLARAWRRRFDLPLIGVTGSNGKTTVKEMTAAILRRCHGDDAVLATEGNLNNEIGMPLVLLRLRAAHRAAVLEMGERRIGDIAYLADIAAPTIGLVTNAGSAHLEFLGDLAGVARVTGELFEGLVAGGTAVINHDDAFAAHWAARVPVGATVLRFGLGEGADFRATDITMGEDPAGSRLDFQLDTPLGRVAVTLPMAGRHNVINALAAAAAATAAGATLGDVRAGLAAVTNVAGRLRQRATRAGGPLYDDSYNANPGSVRAAIDCLATWPGERWLVLGDMAELGPRGAAMHGEIGAAARAAGIHRLFCVGPESRATARAFGPGAEHFEDVDALLAALAPGAGVAVLVKASRSMGLERVVGALANPGS